MESSSAGVVYLDHHATTPVDPRVLEAMLPFFSERYGNASSTGHAYGWEARDAVEHAREQVAEFVGCETREVVFTSGATESNNLALKGLASTPERRLKYLSIVTEHRAVLDPLHSLKRRGHGVELLPVDRTGDFCQDRFRDLARSADVASVMWVNNEIGLIHPLDRIARTCVETATILHCDAVQAASFHAIDLTEIPVHLLSLSAHKIGGPKGIGALIVRRNHWPGRRRLHSLIDGGGHENRLRSGTLAVPLIVGFGVACELIRTHRDENSSRLRALCDRLWSSLNQRTTGLTLNGPPIEPAGHGHDENRRHPGNLNFHVAAVDGEALLRGLQRLAVSAGAACSTADPDPSHVLRALGRSDQEARACLRIGLGTSTTDSDVDFAIDELSNVIGQLRRRSSSTP